MKTVSRLELAVSGLFFCAYLALQTFVPALCLTADNGCLFGWTMYAGRDPRYDITVVWRDGEESSLDEVRLAHGRPVVVGTKVDRSALLPPYLCREFPDATSVRVTDTRSDEVVEQPCPQ